MKIVYRAVLAPLALLIFFFIACPFSKKARMALRLRRQALKERPEFFHGCYWIHASSGEFEYAKSVIREIRAQNPSAKILATYSSPSYARQIRDFEGVDHAEPLPFDVPGPIHDFIKHYKPKILLVARTDIWPEILWQCRRAKIPSVLYSCSFPKSISALGRFWKAFVYKYLDFIFVIKEADKDFLKNELEIHEVQIKCIGDTRIDQVLHRLSNTQIPQRTDDRLCFLAGSTWKEDEAVLLPALTPLIQSNKLQLILVPHEPSSDHIEKLKDQLKHRNIEYSLFSENSYDFTKPVLIVDQVGILASLYSIADISFVGGSFRSEVHSVMESLGAGCMTCVGPNFRNNREAVDFSKIQVNPHWNMVNVVQDPNALLEWTSDVIQNQYELDSVETMILAEVQTRKGASHRLIQELERIQSV